MKHKLMTDIIPVMRVDSESISMYPSVCGIWFDTLKRFIRFGIHE